MRRFLIGAVLVALGLTLGSCGGNRGAERPSTRVSLDASGVMGGDTLTVSGTATVPDGALVVYKVTSPDGNEVHEGGAKVMDGKFSFDVDTSVMPKGDIQVWLAFQMTSMRRFDAEQPREIIELYGQMGEKMAGNTVNARGMTRVVKEFKVTK